jgi:uncharacterized membrane protein YeaQ/YmgE (transglycosylase-associated protein family)
MFQTKNVLRILLGSTLCSGFAVGAYASSPGSLLHASSRQEGETMSFFAWIILGLVAGFIGSKLVNRRGEGILLDVLLGVVGALVGGWLFRLFGAAGVNGLNLYSLFVAVIGSVAFLVTYHLARRV